MGIQDDYFDLRNDIEDLSEREDTKKYMIELLDNIWEWAIRQENLADELINEIGPYRAIKKQIAQEIEFGDRK